MHKPLLFSERKMEKQEIRMQELLLFVSFLIWGSNLLGLTMRTDWGHGGWGCSRVCEEKSVFVDTVPRARLLPAGLLWVTWKKKAWIRALEMFTTLHPKPEHTQNTEAHFLHQIHQGFDWKRLLRITAGLFTRNVLAVSVWGVVCCHLSSSVIVLAARLALTGEWDK